MQQLNQGLRTEQDLADPPPVDEAKIEAELKAIFADAQRRLEAGEGRNVTLAELRRQFVADCMQIKEERMAREQKREARERLSRRRRRGRT
jgi:hypothetical protein